MKSKDIVGPCGLYCEVCIMHRSYEDKDLSPIKEAPVNFVRALKFPAEPSFKDFSREGCLSSTGFSFCEKCDIRKCVMDRNKQWRFECGEFPCEKLFKFKSEWQLPILDNLREIKKIKAAIWLEKMDKEHLMRTVRPKTPLVLLWHMLHLQREKLTFQQLKNSLHAESYTLMP